MVNLGGQVCEEDAVKCWLQSKIWGGGRSQECAVELFEVPIACLQKRICSVVWSHSFGMEESPYFEE